MRILDANCTIGRHRLLQEGGLHSVEHLLADMDHFGIAEALVIDSLSRENHPAEGNPRVLKAVHNHPRLHPAWSVLPPGTDEQPPPRELVAQMHGLGVRAAYLFTGVYQIPLCDWCLDGLLGPLCERGVPLFINPNDLIGVNWDQTDWPGVVDLCRRWPELQVVVSEYRIRRSQRAIYRALEACPNLHIELSGYWLSRGIEYITERFGPERLLFGSGWPGFGHGQTLAMLLLAEVSDDARALIGGGNTRRLLGLPEPEAGPKAAPPALESYTIHDCHGHIGGAMSHYHVPDGDLDSTVRELDRLGVRRSIIFSFAGVVGDERHGNDVTIDAVKRYPERFVGFCLLNPHRGEAAMLEELERCATAGLRGIKLIPHYQGYPDEGPRIDTACRWAHEHGWVILNHYWGSEPHLRRLMGEYPDACYITGHTTFEYRGLMRERENLYVCTCPLIPPGACEDAVEQVGADRLLFGSDLQDLPIPWGLGPIVYARIAEEQKRLILGGNLERILERWSLPSDHCPALPNAHRPR